MTLLGQVAETSQQRVGIMALADERPFLDLWRRLQSWQVLPDREQIHCPTSVPAPVKVDEEDMLHLSPSASRTSSWPGDSHLGQRCSSYRDIALSGYSRILFCVSMHAISHPLILLHIENYFGIETQDFCTHTCALNQSRNPFQIRNHQSSRDYFSCDLQQQYVASQIRKSCTACTFL